MEGASDVSAVDAVLPLLGLGLDVAKRGELKLHVSVLLSASELDM